MLKTIPRTKPHTKEEQEKEEDATQLVVKVLEVITDHEFGATITQILNETRARTNHEINESQVVAALNYLLKKGLIKCSDDTVGELPIRLTDRDYFLLFYATE